MPTTTTSYSFQKPVVDGDEDAWGGYLNANWDKIDDLLDGTDVIEGAKLDDTSSFVDDADNTKVMRFQLSGITTATTRTFTWPDYDGTVATVAGTETFTNKTLTSPTINAGALSGAFTGNPTLSGNPAFTGSPDFSGVGNASTIRTDLGVQAQDAGLTSIAALTPAADRFLYTDGTNSYASAPVTSYIRGLMTDSSASEARATLGVEQSIGVGQTWQDVSGSRSSGTSYQNTTGQTIMVALNIGASGVAQVSDDDSTWISVSGSNSSVCFAVPDQHYYQVTTGTPTLWAELR